jgi:hypothetical protein
MSAMGNDHQTLQSQVRQPLTVSGREKQESLCGIQ